MDWLVPEHSTRPDICQRFMEVVSDSGIVSLKCRKRRRQINSNPRKLVPIAETKVEKLFLDQGFR